MATIFKALTYTEWFEGLRDRTTRLRIEQRIHRLECGNPGQHRVLACGVVEMKIDFGPGYRVYFTRRGADLVLLLVGGDKSTQQQDIGKAIDLARQIE